MTSVAAGPIDAAALVRHLHGEVIPPDDPRYDAARRVWNGTIDRRPALIARCATPGDVAACLDFARAHGLPLAVRGGGHNVAGSALAEGGLVIDLALMREVRVDPAARRVRAGGGVTIGELDRATQPLGLAVPMGVVTETGIAGLTLGGGLGWLRRKHGLSCDALRAAEVVTPDGRVLRASATEHPDLFWALRGGGGNFGVVTAFEFEAVEVGPEVFFFVVAYAAADAPEVLRRLRAYMADAPEAFSPLAVLGHLPPLPGVPEDRVGVSCLILVGPWIGAVAEGERALAPLRRLAQPLADLSAVVPYLQVQAFFDEDYPNGDRYYWKSASLPGLSDGAIETLVALNEAAPSPRSTLDVWFNGGAMSRVGPSETAFGDRSAPILIGVEANWSEPAEDEANVAWARRCIEALAPFGDGRLYLNFPGRSEDGDAAVRATYGANYARLAALKRRYDPENLLRTHQNIQPAG